MLAALLVTWPLARWLGWRGFEAYGLERFPCWWLWVAGGLGLAALAKAVTLVAGPGEASMTGATFGIMALLFAVLTTFVPSLVEDILTRGFPLRTFPLRLGGVVYVVACAALYTLNHVWRFDWGASEQIRLFCMGLAYAAAAWRWRTLWGAVALHWGWNLANALSGPLVDVEGASTDAVRLAGAAAHLALLVLVLLLPAREEPTQT